MSSFGQIARTHLREDPRHDADKIIETAITKPYAYLPTGYSAGIMPSNFAQRLTPAQIQGLVNFLSSAAK